MEDAKGIRINEISGEIIGASMKVHSALGPGLLESAYEACLHHELGRHGVKARAKVALPIRYEGIEVDAGYRLNLLVEDEIIVELKSVEKVVPTHEAQLLSFLKLSDRRLGLRINFNVVRLWEGIKRIVNRL